MQRPTARPAAGGTVVASGLLLGCALLFIAPATLVTRGYSIAGDRQKENSADIAAISAAAVQKKRGSNGSDSGSAPK